MTDREALRLIMLEVSANTPGELIARFRRELIVEKILAAGFQRCEVPDV